MFVGMILLCVNTECKLLAQGFKTLESCEAEAKRAVAEIEEGVKGITKLDYKCEAKGTKT